MEQTSTYSEPQLKDILDKRISSNSDSKEHIYTYEGREYIVLPDVFSPAFFPNTQWYTHTFLKIMPTVHSFLQVGTGAGNVLVEALLQGKCQYGVGSDISEPAVENARRNGEKFKVNAEWVVSDVLDSVDKSKKFDLIYWNYPYHWSFDREYQVMTEVERTVRDPGYSHLDKFLSTAQDYLSSSGYIITSYSLELANTKEYTAIIEKNGWKYKMIVDRQADPASKLPHLALLQITRT